MANPTIVTLTAPGYSPSIALDLTKFGDGVGLVIGASTGSTVIYTVEVSGDRLDVPDSSKLWVGLPLLLNQTGATTSNLAYPVTAIRLNAGTVTSGTLQLSVIYAI